MTSPLPEPPSHALRSTRPCNWRGRRPATCVRIDGRHAFVEFEQHHQTGVDAFEPWLAERRHDGLAVLAGERLAEAVVGRQDARRLGQLAGPLFEQARQHAVAGLQFGSARCSSALDRPSWPNSDQASDLGGQQQQGAAGGDPPSEGCSVASGSGLEVHGERLGGVGSRPRTGRAGATPADRDGADARSAAGNRPSAHSRC
jgi:hypothetical protein